MHEKLPSSGVKRRVWLVLASSSIVLMLAAWSALSLNGTLPPNVLQGRWTVTDLRGPPDGAANPYEISISRDGTFDNHDGSIVKLRFNGSRISVRSWLKDLPVGFSSKVRHFLFSTFQVHRNDFDLDVAISDDQNEMKLAFPGEPPFKVLTRIESK